MANLSWEKVHVFISSTFNDMHADRDYLVKRVFPELRDWCERRKLRLVDIDLRWGVTEQDATHGRNVVKVCLSRIDDCRPFFLCLLGQRRGWVPAGHEISGETLGAFPDLRPLVGAASVTEMEILHALVSPLHRSLPRDASKSAEYYEPARHVFFFLRDPSYVAHLPGDPPMVRETYTNEWIEDPAGRQAQDRELERWREVEIPRHATYPVHRYSARWDPGAVTPELAMPLQCPSAEAANVERWRKQWRKAGVSATSLDVEYDPVEADRAREFNRRLSTGRLSDFTCDGTPLSTVIIRGLQTAIADRYPAHAEVEHEDELQKEIDQQEQFLFGASEGFIEREGDFAELDAYVEGDSTRPLVLTAAGGMGKSTLLANWVDRYRTRIQRGEGPGGSSIHFRFIGQSDRSTTITNLLHSLLGELQLVAHKIPATKMAPRKGPDGRETSVEVPLEIPIDPKQLRTDWPALLEEAGRRGRTVIVIDALNQLESGLADVGWLPRTLPANVKMIVSFKRGEAAAEALHGRLRDSRQVDVAEVRPFERLDDRRRLVRAYLAQYLKELDEQHLVSLITLRGAGNPLYLKVVLSELRVFGAYANLAAKIHSDFGDTPASAFERVLERLEQDPAYAPIEPGRAVPLLFGLLAHARRGLSADELTVLLVRALDAEGTNTSREGAADTVHLLVRQVQSFLARREGRYDFFFESFKQAAHNRYVAEGDNAGTPMRSRQDWHGLLAGHFGSLPTWEDGASSPQGRGPRQPTRRKVAEYPFHLVQAQRWDDVDSSLCDLDFVEAKCAAGLVYELVDDYSMALASLPNAAEEIRAACVRDEAMAAFARALIACAGREQEREREEFALPDIPASVRIRTDEEIGAEAEARLKSPARLDRIRAFSQFVGLQSSRLAEHGCRDGFCIQQAHNLAVGGPVVEAADRALGARGFKAPVLLLRPGSRARPRLRPALLSRLEGHRDGVNAVAVTPDGRRAVSGSGGMYVYKPDNLRVWDIESGRCIHTLIGHPGSVLAVAITPDGRWAASGSGKREDDPSRGPLGSRFTGEVRLWDLDTGHCVCAVENLPGQIGTVALTANGKRIVAGGQEDVLRVWDLEGDELYLGTIDIPHATRALTLRADGRLAFFGDRSGKLHLWDLDNATSLCTLDGHSADGVNAVAVSADWRTAMSGGRDLTVRTWDLARRECVRVFRSEQGDAVGISADGRLAVSGGFRSLRVWNLERGESVRSVEGHRVNSLAMAADGSLVISACEDHALRVWDFEKGQHATARYHGDGGVNAVALAESAELAASGGGETLCVWEPESERCTRAVQEDLRPVGEILTVALSPDGLRVLSGGGFRADPGDRTVNVYDVETGRCLHRLEKHHGGIFTVGFTPDGRLAVSGGQDHRLRVWDVAAGRRLRTFVDAGNQIDAFALTPDGRAVVSTGPVQPGVAPVMSLWSLDTGHRLKMFRTFRQRFVKAMSFTPDGRRLVLALQADWRIHVWGLTDSDEPRSFAAHSDEISALAITPDGRRVMSAGRDESIRVWDIDTGDCEAVSTHLDPIHALAARRSLVVAGDSTGHVFFFDMRNLETGPVPVTATRLFGFGTGTWDEDVTARCGACCARSIAPAAILEVIRAIGASANLPPDHPPCLRLPPEAWNERRLLSACPRCRHPWRFNPFVVDNRERSAQV